jgi:simple sugar transport system ATP-binding protein
LLRESKVVIAEDPTIGLDIRTSQEVMDYLVRLRNRGGGVLLVSEELGDVISYADTVYVLYEGTVESVLPASEATIEKLGGYMLGLDKV